MIRTLCRAVSLAALFTVAFPVFSAPPVRIMIATWDEVTTNVDGTQATPPVMYQIYCGNASRSYQFESPSFSNPTMTYDLYTIPIPDGTWFCAVTANTIDGESDYSNEITFDMKRKHPKPPFGFRLKGAE